MELLISIKPQLCKSLQASGSCSDRCHHLYLFPSSFIHWLMLSFPPSLLRLPVSVLMTATLHRARGSDGGEAPLSLYLDLIKDHNNLSAQRRPQCDQVAGEEDGRKVGWTTCIMSNVTSVLFCSTNDPLKFQLPKGECSTLSIFFSCWRHKSRKETVDEVLDNVRCVKHEAQHHVGHRHRVVY